MAQVNSALGERLVLQCHSGLTFDLFAHFNCAVCFHHRHSDVPSMIELTLFTLILLRNKRSAPVFRALYGKKN